MENTLVDREGSPSGQPGPAPDAAPRSAMRFGPSAPSLAAEPLISGGTSSVDVYAIPRQSERKERVTRVVACAAWLYGLYWIVWRWTETLNWDAPIFSVLLISA